MTKLDSINGNAAFSTMELEGVGQTLGMPSKLEMGVLLVGRQACESRFFFDELWKHSSQGPLPCPPQPQSRVCTRNFDDACLPATYKVRAIPFVNATLHLRTFNHVTQRWLIGTLDLQANVHRRGQHLKLTSLRHPSLTGETSKPRESTSPRSKSCAQAATSAANASFQLM